MEQAAAPAARSEFEDGSPRRRLGGADRTRNSASATASPAIRSNRAPIRPVPWITRSHGRPLQALLVLHVGAGGNPQRSVEHTFAYICVPPNRTSSHRSHAAPSARMLVGPLESMVQSGAQSSSIDDFPSNRRRERSFTIVSYRGLTLPPVIGVSNSGGRPYPPLASTSWRHNLRAFPVPRSEIYWSRRRLTAPTTEDCGMHSATFSITPSRGER